MIRAANRRASGNTGLARWIAIKSRIGAIATLSILGGCAASGHPKSDRDASQFNARLGIEYLRQNDVQGARDKIVRALQQDPQNHSAHVAAAFLYERMGDKARTIKHYDTAVRLKPDDPDTLNNYGVYLCRHNKPQQGSKLMIEAANSPLYRTPQAALNNAGVCLRTSGHLDEAEVQFQQTLKAQPQNREALGQLTALNVERLKYADARHYLQRFLDAGAPTPEILAYGMRIERGLGNDAAAENYAKRLKKEFPTSEQARAIGTSPSGG